MKRKHFIMWLATLLLLVPLTGAQAAYVSSSDSFTHGAAVLHYDISGASLTEVVFEEDGNTLNCFLKGIYIPDEELTIKVIGSYNPEIAGSTGGTLFAEAVCYDAAGKSMEDFYDFGNSIDLDGEIPYSMLGSIAYIRPPENAQEVRLSGSFVLLYYPNIGIGAIEQEMTDEGTFIFKVPDLPESKTNYINITVNLEPAEGTGAGSGTFAGSGQDGENGDDDIIVLTGPNQETAHNMGFGEHTGLAASVLVSAAAIGIAMLGGAAGSAAAMVDGDMGGPWEAEPAPERDFVFTDPATGAQTRFVQDPVTGDWIDPNSGSMLDPSRAPDWQREAAPEMDMIITDPATGAQTRFVQDPVTGDWIDPNSGSMLDPSRVPAWQQERSSEREWINRQNEALQTGDNAFDRHMAEDRAKQAEAEALSEELLRIANRAQAQPLSELNDNIAKNARKLAYKLLSRTERDFVSSEDINRVSKAFIGSATGRIIRHSLLPKVPSDMSLYKNAFWNQIEEISRNETAFAVLFRTAFAIPTGGGSEIFFQSHKGYLRMRDYVDEGGDSVMRGALLASWGAVKDYGVSRASDSLMKGAAPKILNTKPLGSVNKFLKNTIKDPGKLEAANKIIYNQIKRAPRAAINTGDKYTTDIDGKVQTVIKELFK